MWTADFELEARYEAAADPVAKNHFHALSLLSCGYEVEEVAEILDEERREHLGAKRRKSGRLMNRHRPEADRARSMGTGLRAAERDQSQPRAFLKRGVILFGRRIRMARPRLLDRIVDRDRGVHRAVVDGSHLDPLLESRQRLGRQDGRLGSVVDTLFAKRLGTALVVRRERQQPLSFFDRRLVARLGQALAWCVPCLRRSRAVPPRPGAADSVCNKAEKPFAARSGFVGCLQR
jgi:hypothetical protein